MSSKPLYLGVDFGTCNTVVAGFTGSTELKTYSFPSSALYDKTQDKFFYGSSVQNNKYEFTLLKNEKRLIGRKYEELDSIEKNVLELTKKENKYHYTIPNEKQPYLSPIELASKVIQNIVDEAYSENIQKNTIKKCVMSVPSIYSCIRKNGIKQAFEKTDIHLIGIITDTSAAALYLAHSRKDMKDGIIMIYDLGGGVFDVSFLEKKKNRVTVIGNGGDEHLGGEDVLNELILYVSKKVEEKINIFQNTYLYRLVAYECENFIKYHEKGGIKTIEIDELKIDITEDILETIQKRFYEKTIEIVNNTIRKCNLDKKNINYIACVGSCSNNNMIINMLRNNFNKEIITDLDYAVAEGTKLYVKYIERNDCEYIIEDSTYPLYEPSFGIYLDTTFACAAYLKEAGKISESLEVIGKYDLPLDVIEYDKNNSIRSNELSFSKLLKSIVAKSNDKLKLYKNFPVIITIPTEFGTIQRYETVKIAEEECNLKVTQLINNTTACAAYYCKKENKNDCNIIVYDIREKTFSLSFINVNEGILRIEREENDNHLGGENITKERSKFEELFEDYFNKTFEMLEKIHKKYDDNKKELNILLIDESGKIPKIKEIIRLKCPQTYINVEELCSEDISKAAVVCAQSMYDVDIEHYEFKDVLSHSIGREVNKVFSVHHMDKVLTKMAILPIQNDVEVYLDDRKKNLEIYEGESMNTLKNKYVGSIEVSAPKEYNKDTAKLTFSADKNGILKIVANFGKTKINLSINYHN